MKKGKSLPERIVETALRKGADCAQAVRLAWEAEEVNFDNNRLKSAESSQRTKIDVKVMKKDRIGFSITTDPRDIDGVADRALKAAEFGSTARFQMPGANRLPIVKTYDPAILSLAMPEMIRLGREMMDRIQAYNPEILAGAGLVRTVIREEFANSSGASYAAEHTSFEAGAGSQLVRGTDILFVSHGIGRKTRALDTEEIMERAILYFQMAARIAPIRTGEIPVIFTPSGFTVLLRSLIPGMDGKNVHLGSSPLRGKIGQTIADPSFTLVDDPLLDYGPKTGAFDDEGVPRGKLPLIENGVLRGFLYDLETAERMGTKPTGHGADRRHTNLVVNPGNVPYAEMLRGVKQGVLAHAYIGGGIPINGEFSINLSLGYKIENGEITGRIKDVMLAGNAYDAMKNITAISRECEWIGGPSSFISGLFPYIQVGRLSVVTK